MGSGPRRAAALAVAGLLVSGLTACGGSSPKPDRQAAQRFLDDLGRGDAAAAAGRTTDPAASKAAISASVTGLGHPTARFTVDGVTGHGSTSSTVAYSATWNLPGAKTPWKYNGSLEMSKTAADGWRVAWQPSVLYPGLAAGQHLASERVQPPRADLLDSSGVPLFSAQPVVTVGIAVGENPRIPQLAATLASVLQISAGDIVNSVKGVPAGQFVPVITLRKAAYLAVKPKIHELPGVHFQTGTELLGPTSRFAQPLLGQVGSATQELIDASNGTIVAGDETGLSGLQLALNSQLSGTPGIAVDAVSDADPSNRSKLVDVSAPGPGSAVHLTLDRATQTAAEAAVATVALPASIVVTRPSTGEVLAVANNAATGSDAALDGQFPPGSTFKIATYAAVFSSDPALQPTSPQPCPATITVNGQTIRNENDFAKGTIPISSAFAFSCNTTAAALGMKLPAGALLKAAQSLGLGQPWSLPVDAFSGSLPEPASVNEQAADAYGQGKVLVSPLLMAEMAGAASTGRPIAPSLVVGRQATPGAALPASVVANLNVLMRDVVTVPGATGRALADLPGGVEGKTGTAEFGTAVPARSHSWFAGTRGDLAFSVFINGGGNSDSDHGAVSVTHALLSALPVK
ncbi:cell division protein FtsI/penicillin-binding protein 2 [Jatrophihabitans sp. GAS493]|uniref:penicillin-binding transpeptidase domain-containing protein n=1 Tax=Jatrophihabitans sp. GAS493 TaxID=1907575 RepID=UPI000BBFAAF5|nr:penicillin-binding transpeptidase domain-containing protein [Jatrophihabitans sp. GAS493]SOD71304.1 cell division protein FtsI/penicillin-binding protein 2 [Jatrophihabitans sp. GAS493]